MPTLNATPPQTARPEHTRRRAWAHPELTSHSLLVLTAHRLHVAPQTGHPRPEHLASVEAGADLDELFGPLAVVIDLVAVRRLKLNLLTNSLVVEYVRNGYSTLRQRLTFATPEAADACFTKVWRRLGDGFRLSEYQRPGWEAARGPLMLLFGSLVATALLVLFISIFTDFGMARAPTPGTANGLAELGSQAVVHEPPLRLLLGWLDWRLVCAVGGVAAAASQVWLYRRLTTPPVSLELLRN